MGDNIFYGGGINDLTSSITDIQGGVVFAYPVNDPQRYGVVEFNESNRAISIEEKPAEPKSNYVVSGLYFYDNSVIGIAKQIVPSSRGELEITDVNLAYLNEKKLKVIPMDPGTAWLDTGTIQSLYDAGNYVRIIEQRHDQKIGCIEEAAYTMGYINKAQLIELANPLLKSGYGQYLLDLIK